MKSKSALLVLPVLAVAGGMVYLYGGGSVPAGQPPLEYLNARNVSEVENAFNAAKADTRVLLLLSPT